MFFTTWERPTSDPAYPQYEGILVQGRDGDIYSTSQSSVYTSCFCGTVFKITPSGTITDLFDFNWAAGSPFYPRSGLTLGVDGNYYGTTSSGGTFNFGTVFKFTGGGTMTTLYVWHGQISQGRRLPPLVTPSPGHGPSFVCCPGRNASDGVVGIDTSEDARFSDRSIQGLCLFRILIISVAESELVAMR